MDSWTHPQTFGDWLKRIFTLRPVALMLLLSLAVIAELRFDWAEQIIGRYLVATNQFRPESGAIWEKVVFGKWLFARPFFWEDVFSMLVLALHTAYLVALFSGALGPQQQMWLALAAYAAYVINAAQFLVKLRAARRDSTPPLGDTPHLEGAR